MAPRITQDAIEKVRAEFTQRLSTTGRVGARVVIPQDITADDLDQLPSKWLKDTVFSLQDGVLSIHQLTSLEQSNLRMKPRSSFASMPTATAHVAFERRKRKSSISRLALSEVIVGTASCVDMANAALGYLRMPTVGRVVLFQIFPPVASASTDCERLWQVPALAVVFGYEDPTDHSSPIRMLDIMSFGEVGIPKYVVDSLVFGLNAQESESDAPDLEPLDRERGQQLLEPGIPMEIRVASVLEDVEAIRSWASPLQLRVPMAQPLEDITFDLVPVFAGTISQSSKASAMVFRRWPTTDGTLPQSSETAT